MWIDDQVLTQCYKNPCIESWIPNEDMVVLGRSNKEEMEVNIESCKEDNIPILKRYGGGGTVVLHSGCVVVSVGAWVSSPYNNDVYFSKLNQSLIRCFQNEFTDLEFCQRGFSDIVIGDKKFVGTSLFRSRNYLLYQASILVDLNLDKIRKYLKHPSKEPDYRNGRTHGDFLTSLATFNPYYTVETCLETLSTQLGGIIEEELGSEWVEPNQQHIPHLLKRAKLNP